MVSESLLDDSQPNLIGARPCGRAYRARTPKSIASAHPGMQMQRAIVSERVIELVNN